MATGAIVDHETHEDQDQASWSGANEPFQASYGKLMMWYFLVSDAFTFAGFLIAYGALRFSMPTWPLPDFVFSTAPFGIHHMPLVFVTFMTFVLIISSVTMVRAVQEGHRENQRSTAFWLFLTILGGATFLGCQAWEWNNLIGTEHMTVTRNPFGTHTENGFFLEDEHGHAYKAGQEKESFTKDHTYLIHRDHDSNEFIQRKYQTESGKQAQLEFGPKAFGGLFFFITGFHGFHVFTGVLLLVIVLINVLSGLYVKRKNGYEMVEKIGLYWHFVDLVWVFVFLVFYLI